MYICRQCVKNLWQFEAFYNPLLDIHFRNWCKLILIYFPCYYKWHCSPENWRSQFCFLGKMLDPFFMIITFFIICNAYFFLYTTIHYFYLQCIFWNNVVLVACISNVMGMNIYVHLLELQRVWYLNSPSQSCWNL